MNFQLKSSRELAVFSVTAVLINLAVFFLYKEIFFLFAACFLLLLKDHFGNMYKISYPVAIVDILCYAMSYAYGPVYGIIVILFSLFTKIIYIRFESEHIYTNLILAVFCFIVPFLRDMHIALVFLLLTLCRYIMKSVMEGSVKSLFTKNRVMRTILSFTFLFYLGPFIVKLMN